MNEIKYTTDGKKVVVIGDLNQTEKIVQEIFVTEDGAEIPSGERFVVKSLIDAPAKSWKEQVLAKLEARFEKDRKYWDDRIRDIEKEKSLVYNSLSLRVKWLRQVAKQPHPESLQKVVETLALFLSNTDMWVFYADYWDWYLEKYDEEGFSRIHDNVDCDYNRTKLESMKLVSIYGKTDGDFQFQISKYWDGSGTTNNVEYFKSKEDAMLFIQRKFDCLDLYNESHLKIAEKFNLVVDEEKVAKLKNSRRESILKDIEKQKETLKSYQEALDLLDNPQ